MSGVKAYVVAGFAIGLFLGLSSGVAFGGTAYNGAFVFAPIGALIGWLTARSKLNASHPPAPEIEPLLPPNSGELTFERILTAGLTLFANLWNLHIDLLKTVNLLPVFVRQPWLFFILAVLIALIFPPFLGLYFLSYLGAAHFGTSEQTSYRAKI